jgi:biotin carboxyl carrier protein
VNDHRRIAFVPRLAGTAVIAAFLSAIATPALASSPTTPTPSPFSAAAVAKTVKNTPASVAPAATATAKAPAKAKQASGSFVKSKMGAMVIAVFAVGTGYAIYSARNDRIRGLNR